jgi:putative peptidoglycan lipid II flippase
MGAALWMLAPIAWPYLTGSILRRSLALLALTGGGAAVYGAACFLTGAFRVSDLRALLTRRAATQR